MQKESSLVEELKRAGKAGLVAVGVYVAFNVATAGLESYHIAREEISSYQSLAVLIILRIIGKKFRQY